MTTFKLHHSDGAVSPELMTYSLEDALSTGTALGDYCGAQISFGPFPSADAACGFARHVSGKAVGDWVAYQSQAREFRVARRGLEFGLFIGAYSEGRMLDS